MGVETGCKNIPGKYAPTRSLRPHSRSKNVQSRVWEYPWITWEHLLMGQYPTDVFKLSGGGLACPSHFQGLIEPGIAAHVPYFAIQIVVQEGKAPKETF